MRPRGVRPPARPRVRPTQRGQSLAEFSLIVPFLLILLVLVADFGRYFAAGIRVESLSRTAAEIAAQEYQRASPVDYTLIHTYAWQTACNEADGLPNVTYNGPASQCDGIPTVVCVHGTDAAGFQDGLCGDVYNTSSGVPSQCSLLLTAPTPALAAGAESKYVEVRTCYRFNTIFAFSIPFIGGSLDTLSGDFWIQKVRNFTVADY